MDWGEAGVRVALAGITLLAVCSSLLGVLLGWKLRGEEIRRLKNKIAYLQEELRHAWARKASVKIEGSRIDEALRRNDGPDMGG